MIKANCQCLLRETLGKQRSESQIAKFSNFFWWHKWACVLVWNELAAWFEGQVADVGCGEREKVEELLRHQKYFPTMSFILASHLQRFYILYTKWTKYIKWKWIYFPIIYQINLWLLIGISIQHPKHWYNAGQRQTVQYFKLAPFLRNFYQAFWNHRL